MKTQDFDFSVQVFYGKDHFKFLYVLAHVSWRAFVASLFPLCRLHVSFTSVVLSLYVCYSTCLSY